MTEAGSFTIESLTLQDRPRVADVARTMFESFKDLSPTWLSTLDEARESVVECLEPHQFSRVLVVGDRVAGWVGARHDYGFVWELHPLVVGAEFRGRGYGRALVQDVEALARSRGGLTMLLSTSDESARTSLFGRELYADPMAALDSIAVKRPHPLEFWKAVGYTVVGVVPDAEGPGMPSIILAKRLGA